MDPIIAQGLLSNSSTLVMFLVVVILIIRQGHKMDIAFKKVENEMDAGFLKSDNEFKLVRSEIKELRLELKGDIKDLRNEMKEISIRTEHRFEKNESDLNVLKSTKH